jgi:hypothetical protein
MDPADEKILRALKGQQANSFGPMTPEQEQQLQRDAIQPSMGPADMAVPMGGGLAAALYAIARAGGLPRLIAGVGAGAAGSRFVDNQYQQADTMRDAEGQPGGFYGNKRGSGPGNR